MAEGPKKGTTAPQGVSDDGVDALAARALSVVASRVDRSNPIRKRWLDDLGEAARFGGRNTCEDVARRMIADNVAPEDIADHYIPELARQMGEEWCQDSMNFAEVTIGVSRLQSLLRTLGPEWRSNHNNTNAGQAALVIVATDNFHTLGAMILAGKLRRLGLSVRLELGAEPDTIVETLRKTDYGAVLISAYKGESLERLRRMVEAVRELGQSAPPVVLGGSILTNVEDRDALLGRTGCDFVTNDVSEALDLCNLKIRAPEEAASPPPPGT